MPKQINQQDRIEEVKEILPELRGYLENFAKDTVEYFQKTGLVYPPNLSLVANRIVERLTQICRLFPQPLTDEGLRAEIRRIILEWATKNKGRDVVSMTGMLNQILALLPDIEEAKDRLRAQVPNLIEEAKEQERERVLGILEKEYPAITTWQCWQALKGEESEKEATNDK